MSCEKEQIFVSQTLLFPSFYTLGSGSAFWIRIHWPKRIRIRLDPDHCQNHKCMKIFLNWKFLSVRDEPDILLDIKFPNRLPSDHLNPAGYLIRNTGSRWIFGWISGILLGARAGFSVNLKLLSCYLKLKAR